MATTSTGPGESSRTAPQGATRARPATSVPVPVGSVVLAMPDADLECLHGAMELAVHAARQRAVPLVVLHASGRRRELAPGRSWSDEKRAQHSRQVLGLVAHRLRRMARFDVEVVAVSSTLTAVDALLAASQLATTIILPVPPRPHPHLTPGPGPGPTVRVVVTRAACPVVVVPENTSGLEGRGIVVGVEEHGRAQSAVRVAMEEAAVSGVPVTAVHAWDVVRPVEVPPTPGELSYAHDAADRLLGEALAGLAEDYPTVRLRRRVVRGKPADVLREAATTAGLLVVARHGRSSLGFHTLGRTTRALLHQAPCPVVVTPPSRLPRRRRNVLLRDVVVGAGY